MNLRSNRLASPVVELRQYTLKPGRRDELIDIFDGRFVEPQETAGMTIIGQFRDLDRPDMFVWLRGFPDIPARKAALEAFYGGPVWAANRDAANDTMIDSDDVLLLKPAWERAGFDLDGLRRSPSDAEKPSRQSRLPRLVAVEIHYLQPGHEAAFAEKYRQRRLPQLTQNGGRLLAAFVTEHAENTFPRLPVRTDANVFAAFVAFDDADAYAILTAAAPWHELVGSHPFTQLIETRRLSSTSRSLI